MDKEWDEFKDPNFANWKRVRMAIEHENILTNARMNWLLSAQGFLLGAYVLVFSATTRDGFAEPKIFESALVLYGLVFAGMLVSFFLSGGIRAAYDQHNRLKEWWWIQVGIQNSYHPPICGFEPLIWRWTIQYYHFPKFFVPVWLVLAMVPAVQKFDNFRAFIEPYVLQYGTVGSVIVAVGIFAFWVGRASKKS